MKGLSLYVRSLSKKRHGSPNAFAAKCRDHGLSWVALGGPWQKKRKGTLWINSVAEIHKYGDALAAFGVTPYVWGYPHIGQEEDFARAMAKAAKWGHLLLDPEVSVNPWKARSGPRLTQVKAHPDKILRELVTRRQYETIGLSSYGSAARIRWFPLVEYIRAMIKHHPGLKFVGGQTYVDDDNIDKSIDEYIKATRDAGGTVVTSFDAPSASNVFIVPNYGLYRWNTKRRTRFSWAKKKTRVELRAHLYEFINNEEPVEGMIGWAENFASPALWDELKRFSGMMRRGACKV